MYLQSTFIINCIIELWDKDIWLIKIVNLYFQNWFSITIVGPPYPTIIKGGVGGVQNVLLQRGDKSEKEGWFRNGGGRGGVATFLLSYSSITFTVFVGKVKFPLLLFEYSVFWVSHSRSCHPSLYCTKTWYHILETLHPY